MGRAAVGLFTGMALGFAGYFVGFGALLLVAALGAIGFVAGRFVGGDRELGDLFHNREHGNRRRGDQALLGGRPPTEVSRRPWAVRSASSGSSVNSSGVLRTPVPMPVSFPVSTDTGQLPSHRGPETGSRDVRNHLSSPATGRSLQGPDRATRAETRESFTRARRAGRRLVASVT